jgi:hypothetical protein
MFRSPRDRRQRHGHPHSIPQTSGRKIAFVFVLRWVKNAKFMTQRAKWGPLVLATGVKLE